MKRVRFDRLAVAVPRRRLLRLLAGSALGGAVLPLHVPRTKGQLDAPQEWRVLVGGSNSDHSVEAMAFLPSEITINVGDRIDFQVVTSCHTVTFPPGGEQIPALVTTDPAEVHVVPERPTSTGLEIAYLNPGVVFPVGGDVHDGDTYLNSGLLAAVELFPCTFPQPGIWDYACAVHPAVMKGRVIVQEQGAQLPYSQDEYDAMAADQLQRIVAQGEALIARYDRIVSSPRDGETLWEITAGVGEGQAEVMRFLPNQLEVKTGDMVRWVFRSTSETHSVTFGRDETAPDPLCSDPTHGSMAMAPIEIDPAALLPDGERVYGGAGSASSGLRGVGLESLSTYELVFDTPGEFDYVCLRHRNLGMSGTITVEGG